MRLVTVAYGTPSAYRDFEPNSPQLQQFVADLVRQEVRFTVTEPYDQRVVDHADDERHDAQGR
jgi:shikimate 5-dehydrogenase